MEGRVFGGFYGSLSQGKGGTVMEDEDEQIRECWGVHHGSDPPLSRNVASRMRYLSMKSWRKGCDGPASLELVVLPVWGY